METVYSELTTDPSKLTFESEPKAIARATALLLNRILSDNVFTVIVKSCLLRLCLFDTLSHIYMRYTIHTRLCLKIVSHH